MVESQEGLKLDGTSGGDPPPQVLAVESQEGLKLTYDRYIYIFRDVYTLLNLKKG